MSQVTIRLVQDVEGCAAFQELQRRVWVNGEEDVVPIHVLITIAKNGGGLLGAFSENGPKEMGGMVGATLWWIGTDGESTESPTLKICSHIAGILPEWQNHGIGLRLKLAQRQYVLEQGVTDWISWTYDPLYRPNAIFNIHRLGATCNTYIRNLYGEMTDALNSGSPSDRFKVDWQLKSPNVLEAIDKKRAQPWNTRQIQLCETKPTSNSFQAPITQTPSFDGRPIAIPLPSDIGAIRQQDQELALAWRFYLREMMEQVFAAGYRVVDCADIQGQGWYYILVPKLPLSKSLNNLI